MDDDDEGNILFFYFLLLVFYYSKDKYLLSPSEHFLVSFRIVLRNTRKEEDEGNLIARKFNKNSFVGLLKIETKMKNKRRSFYFWG